MRDIRFRAWATKDEQMYYDVWFDHLEVFAYGEMGDESNEVIVIGDRTDNTMFQYIELMQFTGLLDKNGLTEIYEGDIIGVDGVKKGNIYENESLLQKETDLIIPSITSKDWQAIYIEAMGRGCRHSE